MTAPIQIGVIRKGGRIRLLNADTGEELETFDPFTIAIAYGDPDLCCRLLNWLCKLVMQLEMAAYRPRGELAKYLGSDKRLRYLLDQDPSIRRRRPPTKQGELHPRRMLVHAAELIAALARRDTLDRRGIEKRKREERLAKKLTQEVLQLKLENQRLREENQRLREAR
jgi:hypothetical protein